MKNFLKSEIFWFSFAIIFVAIFAFLLSTSRDYKSQTVVMFLPLNSASAINMEGIMGNAEELAKALPDKKDGATFERLGSSQMIAISAKGASVQKTRELADQATTALITAMSQYYNIKTELDMRIIKQPETTKLSSENVFYKSLIGIIVSFILSLIIFSLFHSFFSSEISFKGKMPTFSLAGLSKSLDNFSGEKIKTEVKSENIFADKLETKESKPAVHIRSIPTTSRKSSAPENLPFADEETMKIFEQKLYANSNGKKEEEKETSVKQEPEKAKEDIFREATPEEVKERLNKLLSGKM